MFFESTTKHGRKAQIVKFKGTISNLNRLLQSFSKSAHEKYCKIRDFRGRGERQLNKGESNRQKQWFYASTTAKPQREAEFQANLA